MEHLFYNSTPSKATDVTKAFHSSVLSTDWAEQSDVMPFQSPLTPWLGFDHDSDEGLPLSEIQDYPSHYNWEPGMIWEGSLGDAHPCLKNLDSETTASAVAAMLQSWLYFGLLESVLRKHVHVSYLVRADEAGKRYIFTRNLHACLQAWVFKIRLADEGSKLETHRQAIKTMAYVHSWVERLNIWTNPDNAHFYKKVEETYPKFTQLLVIILPSIVRLAEMIDSARIGAMPPSTLLSLGLAWRHPQQVRDYRECLLIQRGWCPFTIQMLLFNLSESTVDWLACHPTKGSLNLHSSCSGVECVRNNIDTNDYKVSHDSKLCQGDCPNVRPPIADVIGILGEREDSIPVFSIEDRKDSVNLSVISRSMKTQDLEDYIAISHVWVDGLGSTAEVGIPECQARRLLRLGQEVTQKPNPRLWIDSLCIPAAREARKKAIILMADTYSNASTVLVIDKRIQQQKSSCSIQDLYCTIFTSAWMQRLWTYQEACLAKKLVFELAENDLYTLEFPRQGESIGKTMIWRAFGAQLTRLRIDRDSRSNLGSVSRALNWRSTKRRIDELAAVAGLVQLRSSALGEILETKFEAERMRIFLQAVRWLPRNILFLPGSKIEMSSFRWAPCTFMNRFEVTLSTDPNEQTAECTAHGLKGTWLTLSLKHTVPGARDGGPSIRYVGSNWTKVSRSEAYVFRIYCKEGWPEPSSPAHYNMILLNCELTAAGSSVIGEGAWVRGLAVMRHDKENQWPINEPGVTVCDYVGQVLVEKMRMDEALQYKPSLMFAMPDEGLMFGDISEACLCVR